jgi:hypothetical protein
MQMVRLDPVRDRAHDTHEHRKDRERDQEGGPTAPVHAYAHPPPGRRPPPSAESAVVVAPR